MYVSELPLPGTFMHVDVFGLEKANREHLKDVKESEFHSWGAETWNIYSIHTAASLQELRRGVWLI